ncbi:hypothetical protein JK636_06090 [Clostridium sp. YIM B02515]|uniref:Uncharacterized protein n=1 Tax=Clostridium rhizosphaerae TaxID=2803861 RepID=A0ABS1T7K7_9CLOT|nr:hypothetical protein [Clostridium rhizosphaerae]
MDDVVGKNGLMQKLLKDVIFRIHIQNVTVEKFAHEYLVDFKGRASPPPYIYATACRWL